MRTTDVSPAPDLAAPRAEVSTNAAHRAYLAQSRFGSLDGLRCLCILAVLWHHSPLLPLVLDGPRILQRGFTGVDFFFVLSGFLITTLLLREGRVAGQPTSHGFSLAGFYWRRALRILPVYFFVVTVVAAIHIGVKGRTDYLDILPYYYVFLSNFLTDHIPLLAPTWSLAVEEQYYLIWPLVLLVLPRAALLPVPAAVVALNVLGISGALGLQGFDLGPLRIALPNPTYAPILLGSMLALALDRPGPFRLLRATLGGRAAAPLAFVGVGVLLAVLPQDLRGVPNLILHLAMCAALAALVVREDHALAPALRWPPVARLGAISYGIYLYHLIGLYLATIVLARLGITDLWGVTGVYLAAAVALAEISDRTLERYFRGFRKSQVAKA